MSFLTFKMAAILESQGRLRSCLNVLAKFGWIKYNSLCGFSLVSTFIALRKLSQLKRTTLKGPRVHTIESQPFMGGISIEK